MRLKIVLPESIMVDTDVETVVAEGPDGSFGLLPRHIDVVTPLTASILSFRENGQEWFVAHDDGVLVKQGDEVIVSVRRGVKDQRLDRLREVLTEQFMALDEHQRQARSVLAMLEAGILREVNQQTQMNLES
jgi:F-type H+-transporting ATPase subunit epsilon